MTDEPPQEPNKPRRAFGRNLEDFAGPDGSALYPAEKKLLRCVAKGEECEIDKNRPNEPAPDQSNVIRPGFLRFLALGGNENAPVHEKGIRLYGAYIGEGLEKHNLDLENCTINVALVISNCHIAGEIVLLDAKTQLLRFKGSHCKGLSGDRLNTTGSVNLSGDCDSHFRAIGEVSLGGATVGGNLVCRGGQFENREGYALGCDGIKTTGDVFLDGDNNYRFDAAGQVRFPGATINGDLACDGGKFQNKIDTGGSVCKDALNLQNATIVKNLFFAWKGVNAIFRGGVNLNFAHAGVLVDSEECWRIPTIADANGRDLTCYVRLDGFTYNRLGSVSPQTAKERKGWLERQPPEDLNISFKPQPYEQLASILHLTGHEHEAQEIAIEKRKREMRRDANVIPKNIRFFHPQYIFSYYRVNILTIMRRFADVVSPLFSIMWAWIKYILFDRLTGYGYRVHRAFLVALIIWVFTTAFFYQAADQGVMVPSDPRVFMSPALDEGVCAGENWTDSAACTDARMHREHTPLQPALYALDVILPLAPLGQESAWEPAAESFDLGILWIATVTVGDWFALTVMWFNILFGWIVGLLIAAVVSGVVKRD